jgi:hypothetical protein
MLGYAITSGQNSIFGSYSGPDNIAGMDFGLGFDTTQTLADPTTYNWSGTGGIYYPTGSPMGGPELYFTNFPGPINLRGFEFGSTATHDCVVVVFGGFNDAGNHVVTNNSWRATYPYPNSQCSNTSVNGGWTFLTDLSGAAVDDIEGNDFDGGFYVLGGYGHAINIGNTTAFATIKYNAIRDFGGRFMQTKGGSGWDIEDNYFQDEAMYSDHGETLDIGGTANVTISSFKFNGNTVVQTGGAQPLYQGGQVTTGSTVTGCPSACVLTVGAMAVPPIAANDQLLGVGLSYNCAIPATGGNISGGTGAGSKWNLYSAATGYGSGCANVGPEEIDVGTLSDVTSTIWLTDNNPVLTVTGDVEEAHNTLVYNASQKYGAFYPVGGYAAFGIGQGFNIQGNLKDHDNRVDATGMFTCQQNNATFSGTASINGTTITITAYPTSQPWYPGALLTNTNAGLSYINYRLLAYGATDPNTGAASTCALTGLTMNTPCTMVLSGGNQTIASNATWVGYSGFNALIESNNINLKDGSAITTGFNPTTGPYGMNSGTAQKCNGAASVP